MWTMRKEFSEPEPFEDTTVTPQNKIDFFIMSTPPIVNNPMVQASPPTINNPMVQVSPPAINNPMVQAAPPAAVATAPAPSKVVVPLPIIQQQDEIYYYVFIKASLYSADSAIFGLEQQEVQALSKRFNSTFKEIENGVMIKKPVSVVVNALAQLGYKVISTCGEGETFSNQISGRRVKKYKKAVMLIRNLPTILFLLIWIVPMIVRAAASHKHAHGKERLEDGAFSPKDHDHFDGEGEHHSEFDHEAILGSVKDAEEYDNLPPEESKRRLGLLVQKMDLNSDGFIDRHELKAWILRSFKKLSEEEAEDRFEDLDEDNDDKISWGEYVKDVYGLDSDDGLSSIDDDEQSKLLEDDRQMFKAADLDKDGFLSLDEHVKFHSPEEHPDMLPLILHQTLRDKDLNKDGRIDFQEFIGDQGKGHDKEWLLTEKDRFDTDFDKDHDGYLNHNEILSWIVPSNEEVAVDEVDHLFAASDEDHDDRLSYNEIIDKYDIFVGSEATDYGDHLQNIDEIHDEL
ncbi:CLUMA_CG013742, isoform B [Clunio marinus]|nr:CLUMA_CG013742, isoform B [Clunio marinus]